MSNTTLTTSGVLVEDEPVVTAATPEPDSAAASHEPDAAAASHEPDAPGTTEAPDAPDATPKRVCGPRRRRIVRTTLACAFVATATVGWSVIDALTAPGTDTAQARLAEWGRDHGLAAVVTQLEQWQYRLNPPRTGGAPDRAELAKLAAEAAPTTAPNSENPRNSPNSTGSAGSAGSPDFTGPTDPLDRTHRPSNGRPAPQPDVVIHAPLTSPAATPAPGEGVFQAAVADATGLPIVQTALIRPDNVFTSQFVAVAWISAKHTRFVLHPGLDGGAADKVPVSNQITADQRRALVALFNGGFKLGESKGGYYDNGVTVAKLDDGAASEVVYQDGSMKIGQWGRDLTLTDNVRSVRQNLRLMVDGGQVAPGIKDVGLWGRTDGGSLAVPRSGIGMTSEGDFVYVGGKPLTAPALADLLVRAGAVYGMELDINAGWPTFQDFPGRDGDPKTSRMPVDYARPATRFYDNSTKDFMAVYEQ